MVKINNNHITLADLETASLPKFSTSDTLRFRKIRFFADGVGIYFTNTTVEQRNMIRLTAKSILRRGQYEIKIYGKYKDRLRLFIKYS